MTIEGAIKVLQREKDCVQQAIQSATESGGYVSPDGLIRADDYVDACTLAISALRAQQTIYVTDLYDEDGGDVYRAKRDVTDTDVGKMTNADRIRAMSDEELAEAIAGSDWCEFCDQVREDGTCHAMKLGGPLNLYCIDGCLKWLQQPAEEDDHA